MRGPTEGGSGGGRGHSNMDHWLFSEEHKDYSRRRRRLEDKAKSRAGLAEWDEAAAALDQTGPRGEEPRAS